MSLEIRCNCGWHSQVSDFYLGDRVHCPDCGRKLDVHQQSEVPYGYPPYTTWAKKPQPTVTRPRRRTVHWKPSDDPHANPAFWLGFGALLLSLSGCGTIFSVLLAIFALQNAGNSRRFCTENRIPRGTRAGMGGFMGVVAILLSLVTMLNAFDGWCDRSHGCYESTSTTAPADDSVKYFAEPAAEDGRADGGGPWCESAGGDDFGPHPETDRTEAPKRQPVEPRNQFERWQSEYSERIRQERAQGPGSSDPSGDACTSGQAGESRR